MMGKALGEDAGNTCEISCFLDQFIDYCAISGTEFCVLCDTKFCALCVSKGGNKWRSH